MRGMLILPRDQPGPAPHPFKRFPLFCLQVDPSTAPEKKRAGVLLGSCTQYMDFVLLISDTPFGESVAC